MSRIDSLCSTDARVIRIIRISRIKMLTRIIRIIGISIISRITRLEIIRRLNVFLRLKHDVVKLDENQYHSSIGQSASRFQLEL